MKRREFIKDITALTAGAALLNAGCEASKPKDPLYTISLAQWSLHRALFNGDLDNLEFAKTAIQDFGIDAVEYVNQFFMDKAKDMDYLKQMKLVAFDNGVSNQLIMCDGEGRLGDPDEAARTKAIENHYKWVEAAEFLGCHSIRVNAASEGSYDEQMKLAADGLRRLTEFGAEHGLNVLVENHGGLSSNGEWLSGVMKMVDHPRCGTLPDFGNFRISREEEYDRYKGVTEMMPFAKAVSAKTYEFDEQGNAVQTDYMKMMKIVVNAGYHGHVGIEYEGDQLDEPEGIRATLRLLLKVRDQLTLEKL